MTKDHPSGNLLTDFESEALPQTDELYNFALMLTGNKRIAGNLLQETYVKAFKFYYMLDKSIDFRNWMLRIMKNTYFSSFSKKIKTDTIEYSEIENLFEKLSGSIDLVNLENEVSEKISAEEISYLIASLPDDFKMVIILCNILGFTYDFIADFVDCPTGTVRSRLHRGRKMLFIKLYNYAAEKGYIKKTRI